MICKFNTFTSICFSSLTFELTNISFKTKTSYLSSVPTRKFLSSNITIKLTLSNGFNFISNNIKYVRHYRLIIITINSKIIHHITIKSKTSHFCFSKIIYLTKIYFAIFTNNTAIIIKIKTKLFH